jgi:hypothetical protein
MTRTFRFTTTVLVLVVTAITTPMAFMFSGRAMPAHDLKRY